MFLCIPIICGPVPHTKQEQGGVQPGPCPRCHNNSVLPFKRRTWFELYWIPLIPFKAKHLLICTICQWTALNPNTDGSNTDTKNAAHSQHYAGHDQAADPNYAPPAGRGYDVGYHGEQGQTAGAKV
ncbi:hypothetical protein JCM8097_000261 [Rhodosporidiobolus ruineniae]